MALSKHILTASVLVLNDDDEILLIKSPNRGWELPGGQVKEKESIRVAAIREVKSKTGINIKLIRFCGIYQNVRAGICHTFFVGQPVSGQLSTSDESLDVDYFPIDTALRLVTWKIFRQRILYCLDDSKQPFFVEF
ncbi:NUDIX hydrolase [Paenactinomyces guangxiensis]|uniref:NUDIX hydrolase n=1 Tax=Paenactinomyces guangxiensis TaxID=1490290 RepID=A0A7W1WMV6_9BACL|nr:NUDIX hydrolase [Paenactinomyces guangxiensis]MBA4492837.1 NUDIX hydrolase [Paenactinomyces guangxiensis]MBH8590314.1 NUDIX hydrolase [Paenactinomyces guangxiensis]